jgi:hypothetical protein
MGHRNTWLHLFSQRSKGRNGFPYQPKFGVLGIFALVLATLLSASFGEGSDNYHVVDVTISRIARHVSPPSSSMLGLGTRYDALILSDPDTYYAGPIEGDGVWKGTRLPRIGNLNLANKKGLEMRFKAPSGYRFVWRQGAEHERSSRWAINVQYQSNSQPHELIEDPSWNFGLPRSIELVNHRPLELPDGVSLSTWLGSQSFDGYRYRADAYDSLVALRWILDSYGSEPFVRDGYRVGFGFNEIVFRIETEDVRGPIVGDTLKPSGMAVIGIVSQFGEGADPGPRLTIERDPGQRTGTLPGQISFGGVLLGEAAEGGFWIQNDTAESIHIDDIEVPANFEVGWTSGTIPAAAQQWVTVTFRPADDVVYEGNIVVRSTPSGVWSSNVVAVHGVGVRERGFVVEDSEGTPLEESDSIDFGYVPLGSAETRAFTIRNISDFPLTDLEAEKTGMDEGSFIISPFSKTTLQPGETATFTCQFAPTSMQMAQASIFIRCSNVQVDDFELLLFGNDLNVTPNPGSVTSLIVGPLRSSTETVSTGTNPYDVTIPLTLTSSVPWLRVGSTSQGTPAPQGTANWSPGGSATFNLAIDMAELPLGTYQTTLEGQPGNWSVEVTVNNAQFFSPRVVFEETNEPVEGVIFEVTQPDNSTFTLVSGTDGFPTPQHLVVMEGQYEIVIGSPFQPQPARFATVSATQAVFPVFEVPASFAFAGLSPTGLVFSSGGNSEWYLQQEVVRDGRLIAARSGDITHSNTSWIETTVLGPGSLSYWRRVSSESGYDFFRVRLNGDVTEQLSGEHDWAQIPLEIPSGVHTVRWEYTKDSSVHHGMDAAFLDEIIFLERTGGGFAAWPTLATLPDERRGPLDRNGPLQIQNLLAYAMNLDPMGATALDLPRVVFVNPDANQVTFRYRRSKTSNDASMIAQTSTNLEPDWQTASVLESNVVHDGGDWEVVEIVVSIPSGNRLFFRLRVVHSP